MFVFILKHNMIELHIRIRLLSELSGHIESVSAFVKSTVHFRFDTSRIIKRLSASQETPKLRAKISHFCIPVRLVNFLFPRHCGKKSLVVRWGEISVLKRYGSVF